MQRSLHRGRELIEPCDHRTTIGSYPGEQLATCHLPKGHGDEHEGTVYWSQTWTECETCVTADETEPLAGEAIPATPRTSSGAHAE